MIVVKLRKMIWPAGLVLGLVLAGCVQVTGEATRTETEGKQAVVVSQPLPRQPQAEAFQGAAGEGQLERGIRTRELTINLAGGFEAGVQLTFPASGDGPWPGVILAPGAGVQVLAATETGAGQADNFKLLANTLSQNGLVVLRFYEQGDPGRYHPAEPRQANLEQRLADVEAIINVAKIQPEVDPAHLFLYGWGEGASVAAQVARQHPGLAGLILQAPPYGGPARLLAYQHLEIGLPLLKAEADRDRDGRLGPAELATLPPGPAQAIPLFYIWSPRSTPAQPQFQEGLDQDNDALIDLEQELRPWIEAQIPHFAQIIAQNSPTMALDQLIQASQVPILILQGGQDGWVPPAAAQELAAKSPSSITLKQYPYLGHALSLAGQPATDEFGVMAQEPIKDMAGWVHEIVARSTEIMMTDFG